MRKRRPLSPRLKLDEERAARLERQGVIRRGTGTSVPDLLTPPPRCRKGGDILAVLLDERRQGR
jgi:hypothetical protein